MRIRTITAGIHLRLSALDEQVEEAEAHLKDARDRFIDSGIEVQTIRLSTQPYQTYLLDRGPDDLIGAIAELDSKVGKAGIDFLSVGPGSNPRFIDMAPTILAKTERTNISSSVSSSFYGVMEENIRSAARAIISISRIGGDGIRNFNFTCMGNCQSGIPFFPASYHIGSSPDFSIGLESGGLVRSLMHDGMGLVDASDALHRSYWEGCLEIQRISLSMVGKFRYLGTDTSINPALGDEGSVAEAISVLVSGGFGAPGTMSVCSMLTGVVRDIPVKRTGYCGLMLPVLEDTGLAKAADSGTLRVGDLLAYSSVCGTGLDVIPLPGSVMIERLDGTLRDMASLSVKLNKPLSARLLPVPGARGGDRTSFESPYLVNCRVLPM